MRDFNKDGQILDSDVSTYPGLRVNKNCRRDFCRHKDVLPDLIIEQTLMKSVKITEEMTRRNGMSEIQRVQWLLSMPACSNINNAMQEFDNVQYCTSDQHKECSKSRQERDNQDVKMILSFLTDRNPFIEHADLRNIEKGVTASKQVYVHQA